MLKYINVRLKFDEHEAYFQDAVSELLDRIKDLDDFVFEEYRISDEPDNNCTLSGIHFNKEEAEALKELINGSDKENASKKKI